ncbi:pitrilysin family protein [Oscillatoria sp. FACHB-1406]|uniref:M16 family metallopeptidase n=1 Tax=Oscillatoria sp. FACHB-1406 TaxID=2692846 RepID=UPI0018EF9A31|nr:pitrilysin family protein [Oscillatoria sp. FACHB-1406]
MQRCMSQFWQMRKPRRAIAVWSLVLLFWVSLATPVRAQQSIQPYLDRVVKNVTEFTLDNGMKFIVLERTTAPVVSFFTYADVGGTDELPGKTGAAHFLEHLAFKGTPSIGTTDYAAEQKVLDRQDEVFAQIQAAKAAGKTEEVQRLQAEFDKLESQADGFVKQNEFGQIVESAGGVGMNAATSADYTIYFYSLPANKLELWMSLESERFLSPVFREFYKEKQVILEERKLRTENSPIGKTIEAFLDKAYTVHPYKRPVIGYDEDIRNLTRQDIKTFFQTHYTPKKLTVAVVGDVNPARVKELAQTYFGRYPARPEPKSEITPEPPQTGTREVTLKLDSQPWYIEGYHRPDLDHPDNVVYDLITSLMSDGRTSRLYKALVEGKQLALNAQGFSGFPGDKYPNLVFFYAQTAPNRSVEEVAAALHEEIERLKTEPVSEQDLDRVKTQARADLLRSLDSNSGMAQLLAEYQAKTGDWRNLFEELDRISKVTAADVQRVARETFTENNRTIARILPK